MSSATPGGRPPAGTADRMVIAQARRAPHAVAVTEGDVQMTYGALDEASGRLASALRARGVGPGARVGLAVPPGIDRGVSLLGILRAGAAYVPLDPTYPQARLEFMAANADLSMVVAPAALADAFPNVATVSDPADLVAEPDTLETASAASSDGTAYIIYTSGSTGVAKGVDMPHRALANLIAWQRVQPGFEGPVRTLQFSALGFDAHFHEMFTTWSTGGELVSVEESLRRDPTRLLALMEASSAQRIFLPFVALQQLAEVAITYGPLPTSLRDVVTAGEQLQVNDVIRTFFQRIPACRLHNHYGPSETHVVTTHTLKGPAASWPILPPIGRAIANTQIHLLSGDGSPVDDGQAGELCVTGQAVANGYWRRPELTQERFVSGPAGTGLMYRTGDLARRDDSGRIEFLGRIDDQLKIRGFRVEPGEIEAAILEHRAVRECAVSARNDLHGGRRLTAYVVLDSARPDVRAEAEALQREKVAQWREIWDGTYSMGSGDQRHDLDLRGWVDSYHGQPIPEADMTAWADAAASRVLALDPRSVLEVGVGTGLMLFRVAPGCQRYRGTDLSPAALDLLRGRTAGLDMAADLEFDVAAANEIERFQGEDFDVVVMNSVTQNFPGLDYLIDVLGQASRLLGSGHIFVGDITSACLREAFYTSVEAAQARPGESIAALRGRVERRLGREQELVIDPAFFTRLQEWVPGVTSTEVLLKAGRHRNEMSRFRYDVVIRVGGEPLEPVAAHRVSWAAGATETDALERLMTTHPDVPVVVEGIPNARVLEAVVGARTLRDSEGATVAEWRTAVAARIEATTGQGVEPQDLVDLSKAVGRSLQVMWGNEPQSFDAVFLPLAASKRPLREDGPEDTRPVYQLASQPLNIALMPKVEMDLRASLARTLPEYMVPDRFEVVARLPTTPSGKLDRRGLPEPSRGRPVLPHDYVAPRGETEEVLAAIWGELLGIDRVGVTDSFFDLGGNSILSVKLLTLMREKIAPGLSLVSLFHNPTVRALARNLDGSSDAEDKARESLDDRADKRRRALSRTRRLRRK